MNRQPIPPITNRAEFYEAEQTYQHRRYTARWYRSLIITTPPTDQTPRALIEAREIDRKHFTKQAEKADKEADAILEMMNEYENREAE